LGARDRRDELRAVACDPAGLVLLADHEARDVLQEDERQLALARELDEVRALLRRLGEEDAVVREDADRVALDPRPAADERLAVERLELVEARAVDDARDHFTWVELRAVVVGHEPVELRGIRPVPRTITVSSLIAGTYAPPAVLDPITTATCAIPCADIRAWLKKMRPKWSRSGNTSACSGRNAPPESTR